jgi:uncharacterized delta-60 repeat protein
MNSSRVVRSLTGSAGRNIKRVSTALVLLLALAGVLIYVGRSEASGGDLDPVFNPGGSGTNGPILAMALQPNGKIIIGGEFTGYNGDPAATDFVMRLNSDGTRDATFNAGGSGANDPVLAIALQEDGKTIIGGNFHAYNGVTAVSDFVMRLNGDGSPDTTFNPGGVGANNTVTAVVVQPDGKILIGGLFTAYNGDVGANDMIMRLNADGTRDTTFNTGGSGANNDVLALALQPDGKILAGGHLNTYNGDPTAPDTIMRLNSDGTRDTTFNNGGSGTNDRIEAVTVQPDGKILIGGSFTSYNGEAAASDSVMRLNADGTRDASFNPGGSGAGFLVFSLAVQPEGKILVGGGLGTAFYNGVAVPQGIMRLNSDGTRDTTFNSGGVGTNASVEAVALQPDGRILVAGRFQSYNNVASSPDFVMRLHPAGGTISFASSQFRVTEGGGNATIRLRRASGTDTQAVVKLTLTDITTSAADYRFTPGASDATFNPGGVGPDLGVTACAVQSDGKVVLAGSFTSYNGDASVNDHLMRLNSDGTADQTFNPGGSGPTFGPANGIDQIAIQPDGKILIVGNFTTYNGDPAASDMIMRLNADGTRDGSFNAGGVGANSRVEAMALQPDGKILIGGGFAIYNGDAGASDGLMRLNANGTRDATFNSGGSGVNAPISAITLQPDGKILAGGSFTNYNGNPVSARLVRLNADGTPDTTFNAGGSGANAPVRDIAVQTDGKILIAGSFISYNGETTASDGIMRLNADGTRDVHFNIGGAGAANSNVGVVVLQPDGKILVGGSFSSYNGDPAISKGFMRLKNDGTYDPTFNTGGAGTGAGTNTVSAILVLPDGKIILAGNYLGYNGLTPRHITRIEGDLFATWPAGDASEKTVQLAIVNDGLVEGNESLGLSLSSPSGAANVGNSATLIIQDPNTAPTITSAGPLTRQQGSPATGSQIAMVDDAESGAGGVTVSVTSANPANGVTVSNIVNTAGVITANVVAACSATNASFTLTATDGAGATATAALNVTVTANTAPTLTYASPQSVSFNGSLNIPPSAASDNGSITTYTVVSVSPALATAPTVNSSGVVSITNAQPAGIHTISIRATDNCGVTTDTVFPVVVGAVFGFSTANYNTTEASGFATITVQRTGDLSTPVSVDYASADDSAAATVPCSTANGVALSRCDFITAPGTLNFAAGETTRTFIVLISQDSHVEGPETLTLVLSKPTSAAALSPSLSSATLTIADDVTEPPTNMINDVRNFVRQHYHDFLNREPDSGGWDFWSNQISSCSSNVQCDEVTRVDVSASFFLSIEFQQSGYLVERFYKVAYGDALSTSKFPSTHQLAVPAVRFNEFLRDTQRIGQGVVVLQPGWEQLLENNKQAYALEFVQTARFVTAFPTTLTAAEFVDKLNENGGNVLSASQRTAAINLFGGAGNSANNAARAQAVRQVAEDADLYNAEFNRAFVLAEYFGYLRRNPNDAPESTLDYTGYDFWLTKLNQFNGNYINAEMVKAFLSSIEYRGRFGP